MMISMIIPRLRGGGAEKVFRELAVYFKSQNVLSRVYIGDPESLGIRSLPTILVGNQKARSASLSLLTSLLSDSAVNYILTLGSINLAVFVRLVKPNSFIVIRLGNTISCELPQGFRRRCFDLLKLYLACSVSNCIVCQCRYMRDDLSRLAPFFRSKMIVLYNGVESLPSFSASSTISCRGLQIKDFVFIASSNKPQKSLDTLLKALRNIPEEVRPFCVIAGIAGDDLKFQALLSENDLADADVFLAGNVENIYPYITASRCSVLCSKYEGFSNFALEVAACGTRLVLSRSPGGNSELASVYPNIDWFDVGDWLELSRLILLPARTASPADLDNVRFNFNVEAIHRRYLSLLLNRRMDSQSLAISVSP
jgi:glycosyltransferase involved in cell wall biosynthesis